VALEKTVLEGTCVAGVHTLTLSDVDGLQVGYQVVVAGLGAHYDGTHTLDGIDEETLEVTWTQGHASDDPATMVGRLYVPVTWADSADVEGFLGVEPATPEDEAFLDVAVEAGNEWCYRRRASSGYQDLPNVAPGPDTKLGVILYASSLYRERGSVGDTFQSYETMNVAAPVGSLGQVLRLLGCSKPRIA
jgi:hypothetical protein